MPPSGAPGYGGEDHDWNKARFEYDVSSDAQSASLQLKGMKPGVRRILDEDLADQVRYIIQQWPIKLTLTAAVPI
jgi:hypothetical protein